MKLTYKITLAIGFLAVFTLVINMAWAGQGYFLEKGKEFFIFDNLYINGYLSVGNDVLNKEARPGDVLVSKELTLGEDQSFIFCKDEKNSNKLSINRDCADKLMVWYKDETKGLVVIDTSLNQVQTDKILASTISFKGSENVYTRRPVIIESGCLNNSTSSGCSANQLLTDKLLIYDNLGLLAEKEIVDPNTKTKYPSTITFDANNIILHNIDLGPNDERHKICQISTERCSNTTNCPIFKEYAGSMPKTTGNFFNFNVHGLNSNKLLVCDLDITF